MPVPVGSTRASVGSTFGRRLRQSRQPPDQQSRPKPGVLVVDDDPVIQTLLRLALGRDGFNVWLASNGREAVRLYQAHRGGIGVVLLDVLMPDMDGPATLDALRRINPDVPACFMSGDTGMYEPEELRRAGAACFFAKPFCLKELAGTLRRLAEGAPTDPLASGGAVP